MKQIYFLPNRVSVLAIALLGNAVWAQTGPTTASDPSTPVPPVSYQSVFTDTLKGVETQTIDWKKANAEVGQFRRGHVDILKWEEANPPAKPSPQAAQPRGTAVTPSDMGAGVHKH